MAHFGSARAHSGLAQESVGRICQQFQGPNDKGRGQLPAAFASNISRRAGDQSNAAPTMIFRISSHGDPCEILFVCVG